MCNIDAKIEYFIFLNCCNLVFSQIKIIIKFLKSFVNEGLNFSHMALCERFSDHKCEILWPLSCLNILINILNKQKQVSIVKYLKQYIH